MGKEQKYKELRQELKYKPSVKSNMIEKFVKFNEKGEKISSTLVCTGKRRIYRLAKRGV